MGVTVLAWSTQNRSRPPLRVPPTIAMDSVKSVGHLLADMDIDRPAEEWTYPYMAGVFDFRGSLGISVSKNQTYAVGYAIQTQLTFTYSDPAGIGYIEDWCRDHEMNPTVREKDSGGWRLELTQREDSQRFCRLVSPYLVVRPEQARLYAEVLVPAMEQGKTGSKDGFIRLVEVIDQIDELNPRPRSRKYDEAYFRDLWADDL